MNGAARFWVVCLVLLSLAGCSSNRFAYRNADWFINWALDDYVELNREQQRQFDRALDEFLGWHCSVEMPRYGIYLRDVSAALAPDAPVTLDAGTLQELSVRALQFWELLLSKALDESLPVLQGLDDEQVQQMLDEFAEKNRDFYKEYVSVDEKKLVKLRVERVRDAMRRWAGSISKQQIQLAQVWAQDADNVYGLIYERRERWREQFAALMKQRTGESFLVELTDLLLHPGRFYSAAERERLLANQRSAQQLLLALEQSLIEKQRARMLAELAKITEDISRLSEPGCGK